MSLTGSINQANNTLRTQQIGLQVVGQNIANANTPGYIREDVNLTPAPTQRIGRILLGLGVDVKGVVQKLDKFLEERLRGATSERSSAETQEQTHLQLETIVGELNETDLSTSLNNFFSSISEINNQPESVGVRNLAVLQGQTLAGDIKRLAARVGSVRAGMNERVANMSEDINRYIHQVRDLNVQITKLEGGDTSGSDAVGLRDQRGLALENLAKLIDIHTQEEPNGSINVFLKGDFLVYEGTLREVKLNWETDRGIPIANLRVAATDLELQPGGGELHGLMVSRDEALGGFLDNLDSLATTLVYEFNRVFSSGQGLKGYNDITSEFTVDDATLALDATGLKYTPVNGSFQVKVFDTQTGLTKTSDISVDLNGLGTDTTLNDLVAQLDAVDGIIATVTPDRRIRLRSESNTQQFAFARDTSGILAALGINTFFTGSSALGIGINQHIVDDPGKFAASKGGVGVDSENSLDMASFLDRPLESAGGTTLGELYSQFTAKVAQDSTVARAAADGTRTYEESLRSQHLSISGVNIDEETVRMISYQRVYQAAARYISTLNELLDVLVNL